MREETITITDDRKYFICEKCGAKYKNEEDAKECELLPVPEPKFKVGDRVIYRVVIKDKKGFWLWKKIVSVEEKRSAEVQVVCGPYPPHPLAGRASDFPCTTDSISYLIQCFASLFLYRHESYIENMFRQGSHTYFYGLNDYRRGYMEWFFEEELSETF